MKIKKKIEMYTIKMLKQHFRILLGIYFCTFLLYVYRDTRTRKIALDSQLRAFQYNETKLQICTKYYNNNLYMLLDPSPFFVYVLFLKKIIFLLTY